MSMIEGTTSTRNRFGGAWTEEKLDRLQRYLGFYTQALKAQPFRLVYFDSFAGTGRCHIKRAGGDRVIDGSAKIALDCTPAFSAYHFIEKKKSHVAELEQLLRSHPNGSRATLNMNVAADVLPKLLQQYDWRSTRGVLFLDPYGLQCSWPMLEEIAATKALDVFFLVSLSGLFRQAAVDQSAVDSGKAAALSRFLGTDAWRTALYVNVQSDLFSDDPTVTRDKGYDPILQFTRKRLNEAFPYVSAPLLLRGQKGPPLFALFFMVSNPEPKAIGLASRVSREILFG
ncbi:MAG TPA: three-Cys-motif partner protein TcmP [Rhodocyclaceae bacterium]|nr:three-Cys-motif partner protein TcmP [Rhodocyclaceae bacterium]